MSKAAASKPQEVQLNDLLDVVGRAKGCGLGDEDCDLLTRAIETLAHVTSELEIKGTSVRTLRKLIFGSGSEKLRVLLGSDNKPSDEGEEQDDPDAPDQDDASEQDDSDDKEKGKPKKGKKKAKKKKKGHGRNGADKYTGGYTVTITIDGLNDKDPCPSCEVGTLYHQPPVRLIRIKGEAPLTATIYELERFRCGLCGQSFTADLPSVAGKNKYAPSATAMIALLKYGSGVPWYRLERLQDNLGVPLPASTQWDRVNAGATIIKPVWEALIHAAAQGDVLHNDDTRMKILYFESLLQAHLEAGGTDRSATRTSGIVSVGDEHQIALFFTGVKHAGENLASVLAHREELLGAPIQMCDALSHNNPGPEFERLLGNCLVHGRRGFVKVIDNFPEEVRVVLEWLSEVYGYDEQAREQGLTPKERLLFHQQHSGPIMDKLKLWLHEQFDQKKIEKNSGLGAAIKYMMNHWEELTLFLRVAGAPLDNNVAERALKKAVLHRKNAMFYKTPRGAYVGDIFMSLIHTAELNGVNAHAYLTAILTHPVQAERDPVAWLPWNYQQALAAITAEAAEAVVA